MQVSAMYSYTDITIFCFNKFGCFHRKTYLH